MFYKKIKKDLEVKPKIIYLVVININHKNVLVLKKIILNLFIQMLLLLKER